MPASCAERQCERDVLTDAICGMHYQRRRRGLVPDAFDGLNLARELAKATPCVAHGCPNPIDNVKRGVCSTHYQRLRDNGSYAKRGRLHLRRERVTVAEKTCRTCGETKPAAAFSAHKKNLDGITGSCTVCRGTYNTKRNYSIRTKYGITNAEYLAMAEAQGGLCAICGTDGNRNRHHGKLYVDHDHATGAIRGLLCHGCNVALGFMADEPERLIAAAAYLRRV